MSTQLAGWTDRPKRFLNAHWLNPAFLVPLVEVSPAASTDVEVVDEMRCLLESVGKVPVVCKTSPGYIVPRIQTLAMNEAARLVEEGIASAEDVDRAVKYGFGLRFAILGLLEFIDWGGGDILYYASDYMTKAMGSERFAAPDIVRENMAAGKNGFRDGRGFYEYGTGQVDALRRARMKDFFGALVRAGLHRAPVASGGKSDIGGTV
ncbi:MAG: 3-hydroxyacyl-CoA dehydrogenase family protein [Pseudolabrys sp.]